jgi:predicted dehydrogenase
MVFCSPVSEWHVMASSPTQAVDIDLFRDIAVAVKSDGHHGSLDIARTSVAAVGGHLGGFARAGSRWLTRRQYWGHDALIGAFLDAILNGAVSPVAVSDALEVVQVTSAILRALDLAED